MKLSKRDKEIINKHLSSYEITYEEIHELLKKKIKRDFGTRCPDFDKTCVVCRAYLVLDTMEYDMFGLEDA